MSSLCSAAVRRIWSAESWSPGPNRSSQMAPERGGVLVLLPDRLAAAVDLDGARRLGQLFGRHLAAPGRPLCHAEPAVLGGSGGGYLPCVRRQRAGRPKASGSLRRAPTLAAGTPV